MKSKGSILALAGSAVLTLAATGLLAQPPGPDPDHEHGAMPTLVTKAVAVLQPTEGNQAHGIITFTKEGDGIHVQGVIEGLTPGKHGFHVHEFGDCSSGDGKSAGGHFNPTGDPHAGPTANHRHVGDLGNIEADDNGRAEVDCVDQMIRFYGPRSILGRGLIVHEKADDLSSQPTGDAGGRVACAVIGVAQGGEEKIDLKKAIMKKVRTKKDFFEKKRARKGQGPDSNE